MKRLVLFVLVTLVLFLIPTTILALEIGDINFKHLNKNDYLKTEQAEKYTKNTHTYPDKSIKIVQVIFTTTSHIVQINYLKDGELFVYKDDIKKYPGPQGVYIRVTDLSPEEIKKITAELKSFSSKQ